MFHSPRQGEFKESSNYEKDKNISDIEIASNKKIQDKLALLLQ